MSRVPDPMCVHWPEMIDNQEKNTVFLKPLITEHVRTIWTGTPAELEQAAKDAGLLD